MHEREPEHRERRGDGALNEVPHRGLVAPVGMRPGDDGVAAHGHDLERDQHRQQVERRGERLRCDREKRHEGTDPRAVGAP